MQIERSGILILMKPKGWTSFDVIAKARGILSTKKVGHSGTLDPMATGVLPIFMGRATKAVDMQIIKDKEYLACFRLGLNTDTGDITGLEINRREVGAVCQDVIAQLENFKGEIKQLPPMYSAVKVNGQPLYKLARQGVTIERKERTVTIKALELLQGEEQRAALELMDTQSLSEHEYVIRVLCTEGTYIRTLVEDIGENLGCGAVLTALTRTMACGYTLTDTVSIEQLQKARADETIQELIAPVDTVFTHLPRIDLSRELALRALHGAQSRIAKPDGDYRAYYEDKFYAVAKVTDKIMSITKLFVNIEKENLDAGSL
ncbi:MAG: tRNA pseudouridine(55) synthase TruB [Oscillospiraceae bacterium]